MANGGAFTLVLDSAPAVSSTTFGFRCVRGGNVAKIKMVNQENATSTTNNPVGWWKFDEATAIHGSLMDDSSGYGNTGTLTTNDGSLEKSVAGKLGKGLSFDGVNDYVNLGVGGLSEIHQTPITITAWIKAPIQTASYAGILSNDYLDPRTGFTLSLRSIGYLAFWSAGDTWDTGGNYVADNKWHFVVATLDISGNLYFYVDNKKDGPYSNALFNSSAAGTYIGRRFDGSYFNGLIDDVRIYNRALSASEVAQQYNSTKDGYLGKIKVSTGLVGYWKMDDNLGTTAVRDYSGKNNNGVFSDATGNPFTSAHATSGQIGSAMTFDGVDDYVDMGNGASLQLTDAVTVCVWIKNSTWGNQGIVVRYQNSARFVYGLKKNGNVITFRIGSGDPVWNRDITNTSNVSANWDFICGTYDRSMVKIYFNGVLENSTTETRQMGVSGHSVLIGNWYVGASYNYTGLIDDVRIYNYARNSEQIKQDYERGLRGHE